MRVEGLFLKSSTPYKSDPIVTKFTCNASFDRGIVIELPDGSMLLSASREVSGTQVLTAVFASVM